MSEQQGFVYGFVDDNDKSLISKDSSGVFGLNNALLTNIEYIDKTQKGDETSAVTIEITIDGQPFWRTMYEVTGDLYGKNNELIKPGEEGYMVLFNEEMRQRTSYIVNLVKSVGVTDQQLKSVFSTPATSFKDWAERVLSLLPKNYKEVPMQVFLEYQWAIEDDKDRTFLILPKNMKGGKVFSANHEPVGEWKAVNDGKTGLTYVDDAGNVHPEFTRNKSFMEGNKANQQTSGGNALDASSAGGTATASEDDDWN